MAPKRTMTTSTRSGAAKRTRTADGASTSATTSTNAASESGSEPSLSEPPVLVNLQSDTSGNSIERLANLMATYFEKSLNVPVPQNFGNFTPKGDALPEFDPKDKNQEAELWCNKVDELREVYKWSEQATIHFALSKLKGSAEVWYKGLRSVKYCWAEWKEKLCGAFPSSRDYYTSLLEMVDRKKKKDEDFVAYCHEKLALLTPLKIEGVNAVSCIIGGLNDEVVAVGAKAGNHKTPESLLAYLNTLPRAGPSGVLKSSASSFSGQSVKKSGSCFKCGKSGHIARNCFAKIPVGSVQPKFEPNSDAKGENNKKDSKPERKCTYCGKNGHLEVACFKKKREEKSKVA